VVTDLEPSHLRGSLRSVRVIVEIPLPLAEIHLPTKAQIFEGIGAGGRLLMAYPSKEPLR
jgi:hypothetical protein